MQIQIERRRLEEVVVGLLGPYLGESMAKASIAGHCKNLNLDSGALTAADVERVIQQLHKGMNLFVGPAKAGALADALRRQLGLGAGEK